MEYTKPEVEARGSATKQVQSHGKIGFPLDNEMPVNATTTAYEADE